MTTSLLEIDQLTVLRGGTPVLRDLALLLAEGERVALIGDNGAGKSSLLLAIAGHLPTRGDIRLFGEDIAALPAHRRARLGIGFCPEGRRVFAGMTVADNLAAAGRNSESDRTIAEIYRLFPELDRRSTTQAWRLSGGEQQMLALGRAMMGRPRLLLLDEPFLGLAPETSDRVRQALADIAASGVSLLLAEQDVDRIESLCDRSIFLRAGEIAP